MTTPNDDGTAIAIVLRNSVITFGGVVQTKLGDRAAERLAKAEADRDAAVEREMAWRGKYKEAEVDLSFAIETGERRATAAIVADLKAEAIRVAKEYPGSAGRKYAAALDDAAYRYERGDHISEAKLLPDPATTPARRRP